MRYLVLFTLLVLTLISCNNAKPNYNNLVLKSIKINKLKTPLLIHKTKNNEKLNGNNLLKLVSTKDLLSKKDENFYSLFVIDENNKTQIILSNYKTGINYYTTFDNKKYKIIKNEQIISKRGESKPYYIYWSIMKEKYPKYMNWDNFKIPSDSLK